jgi:hypothetical protein
MGLPGQQRPGDRSRRDDDRQLMLEAAALGAPRAVRQLGRPQRARQQRAAALGAGVAAARLPGRWLASRRWRRCAGAAHHRAPAAALQPALLRGRRTAARSARASSPTPTMAGRRWRRAQPPREADSAGRRGLPPLTVATLARFLKQPGEGVLPPAAGRGLRRGRRPPMRTTSASRWGLDQYQMLSDVLAPCWPTPWSTAGSGPGHPPWPRRPPAPAAGVLPLGDAGPACPGPAGAGRCGPCRCCRAGCGCGPRGPQPGQGAAGGCTTKPGACGCRTGSRALRAGGRRGRASGVDDADRLALVAEGRRPTVVVPRQAAGTPGCACCWPAASGRARGRRWWWAATPRSRCRPCRVPEAEAALGDLLADLARRHGPAAAAGAARRPGLA